MDCGGLCFTSALLHSIISFSSGSVITVPSAIWTESTVASHEIIHGSKCLLKTWELALKMWTSVHVCCHHLGFCCLSLYWRDTERFLITALASCAGFTGCQWRKVRLFHHDSMRWDATHRDRGNIVRTRDWCNCWWIPSLCSFSGLIYWERKDKLSTMIEALALELCSVPQLLLCSWSAP